MYFRLSSHKEMFDPVPDQYNVATESSFLKTCMSHLIGKCDVLFINITLGKPVIPTFVLKSDVSISCDVREASDKFCLKSVSERNFHPYF